LNELGTINLKPVDERLKDRLHFFKSWHCPISILLIVALFSTGFKVRADDPKSFPLIDSINALPYEYIVSHLHQSVLLFSENVRQAELQDYTSGAAKALSQLGLVHYLRGDYDESTECYVKAFHLFEKLGDFQYLAGVYGEYGYQLKRRDLPKAIQYMQMAISLAEEKKLDDALKSKLFDNYGVIKEMQSDYDSAMFFYNQALIMKIQQKDSIGIPYSLNKIAGLKARQKKFPEAYSYISQSDQYRAKEKGNFGRAENLSAWADIYLMEGKIDSAINQYNRGLQSANSLGYTFLQQYCNRQLSESYKLKKDFKRALEHYQLYTASVDSVNDQKTRATIADLEINYETAQKTKLLTEKELALKQRTLLLIIAVGSIAFLFLIIIWIYLYQNQKRKQIKHEMELHNKLSEEELKNRISSEKLRISRELHDNIGSRLTFIISSLDNLLFARPPKKIIPQLSALNSFGRETLNDLRNTIWAMKDESGTVEKLILKIHDLIQRLNANNDQIKISIEKRLSKDKNLSSIQMLNLFRIVQEALQNSLKYSAATTIRIQFETLPNGILMRISDNGKGFDCSQSHSGYGIANMQARCQEAGGVMQLHSDVQGTTVECQIRCI